MDIYTFIDETLVVRHPVGLILFSGHLPAARSCESRMRILKNVMAAVLLHLFLLTAVPSTADIISLKLRSNDQHVIVFSEFEFSHGGYVSFLISSFTATSTSLRPQPNPSPSRIGFALESREMLYNHIFEFEQNTVCALDYFNNSVLFTFQDHHSLESSYNKSYPVTYPGMYSLFFVNCNGESLVSMEGRAELYNTDDGGTTKNYLSAGLKQLPLLYVIVALFYLCFLGFWILVCVKNRRSFHRVHLLMSGLLVMNFVQLICAAADLYYVKVTGTPPLRLDVLFFIFQLIRTVLLFNVIVLIFTGWCFWKPFLGRLEKLVLLIVILLKVWANIYSILAWKAGPYSKDWITWNDDSQGVDIFCCFVIFVPLALSFITFDENLDTVGNAPIKLGLFGMMVFVYVVFTTIFLPGLFDFIPWRDYGVEEISLYVLCMVMFCFYRPLDELAGAELQYFIWGPEI